MDSESNNKKVLYLNTNSDIDLDIIMYNSFFYLNLLEKNWKKEK